MSNTNNYSLEGTIFKLNINMKPIGSYRMSDINWDIEAYADIEPSRKIKIEKSEAIQVDSDNYIIAIDSAKTGPGRYSLIFTAYIPDGDCVEGIRIEKIEINTGVRIK